MAQQRYMQLIDVVREATPKRIAEIGVHKGLRSALLCREALKYQETVSYVGFDVFDLMDQKFHDDALNGKGMPNQDQAMRRLVDIGPALDWRFVKGDTRQTLHGKTVHADLVFIDGDHRLSVIRGDYESVKSSKCVVFDDYYVAAYGDYVPVDLNLHGCNLLVNELAKQGLRVERLQIADRCNHGAYAQLAVVWNE